MTKAEALTPLPFFFRKIEALDQILLTNLSGTYVFVDDIDELQDIIHRDCGGLASELKEELRAKSFVATENEYDMRASLIGSKFASLLNSNVTVPSLFLVIPTLRCDQNCQYCQVSRVSVSRDGYDLNNESISKILNIIRAIPNSQIKIEFQGGEPLLAFPYIQQFIEKAEEVLSDREVEFIICSALGPLNEDILKWAQTHNLAISTSLDGPVQVHDENRPAKGYQTYQNTIVQIDKIKSYLGPDKLGCLTTVTNKSLGYSQEIVNEYFQLGLEGIFLRPLSPFGFAINTWNNIGYSAREYFEFYKSALNHVIGLNEERHFVEENTLIHLRNIFRPAEHGYTDLISPSGFLLGAVIFNYDGNIFGSDEARMLWESTKNEELVLGNLNSDVSEIFNNKFAIELLTDTFIPTLPGCDECAYQPFCGADPLYHMATQGDHVGDKSRSFFCQLERLTFDHLFKLHTSSEKARGVFDQWLSL